MAVNPKTGTSTMDEAVGAFEGILEASEPTDEVDEVETEEVETEESEAEAEETETEDDAESDEESEEPDEEIENLEQLAEATGRSVEDLLAALKTTVKVDGETSEVTLSELKAGYQKDRDYRQKTEALKREREQWEGERANYVESVEQQHRVAAYILSAQEKALMDSMNSEEMAQLKQRDEQKWLMRRYEFQEQIQQFQQLRQQASQHWTQFHQQQQEEQQKQMSETFQREREALDRALPNLNKQALSQYLSATFGFTPDEIGQVMDHRYMMIAEKARLFDEQKSKAEATVAKVKKAPKAPMPSKGQSPQKIKRSELSKVRSRLKKTGKVQDAAEYFLKADLV